MNRQEIIDIAREVGMDTRLASMGAASIVTSEQCDGVTMDDLLKLAALVAAKERENCARFIESYQQLGLNAKAEIARALRELEK